MDVPQPQTTHPMQTQQSKLYHPTVAQPPGDPAYGGTTGQDDDLGHTTPNGVARTQHWSPIYQSISNGTGTSPAADFVPVACVGCRIRKKKCDNGQPCETCRKKGHACIRPARKIRQGRTAWRFSQSINGMAPHAYPSPSLPMSPQRVEYIQMFQETAGYSVPPSSLDPNPRHYAPTTSLQVDYQAMDPNGSFGGQDPSQIQAGAHYMPHGAGSGHQGGMMDAPLEPSLAYWPGVYFPAPIPFMAGWDMNDSQAQGYIAHGDGAGAAQSAASVPPDHVSSYQTFAR